MIARGGFWGEQKTVDFVMHTSAAVWQFRGGTKIHAKIHAYKNPRLQKSTPHNPRK